VWKADLAAAGLAGVVALLAAGTAVTCRAAASVVGQATACSPSASAAKAARPAAPQAWCALSPQRGPHVGTP